LHGPTAPKKNKKRERSRRRKISRGGSGAVQLHTTYCWLVPAGGKGSHWAWRHGLRAIRCSGGSDASGNAGWV
jgi:hypothetical protein